MARKKKKLMVGPYMAALGRMVRSGKISSVEAGEAYLTEKIADAKILAAALGRWRESEPFNAPTPKAPRRPRRTKLAASTQGPGAFLQTMLALVSFEANLPPGLSISELIALNDQLSALLSGLDKDETLAAFQELKNRVC